MIANALGASIRVTLKGHILNNKIYAQDERAAIGVSIAIMLPTFSWYGGT